MAKLTKVEKDWLAEANEVLSRAPKRFGFFTTGDPYVTVYDRTKEDQIDQLMRKSDTLDFCNAVPKAKADFDESVGLKFTAYVHATSG